MLSSVDATEQGAKFQDVAKSDTDTWRMDNVQKLFKDARARIPARTTKNTFFSETLLVKIVLASGRFKRHNLSELFGKRNYLITHNGKRMTCETVIKLSEKVLSEPNYGFSNVYHFHVKLDSFRPSPRRDF